MAGQRGPGWPYLPRREMSPESLPAPPPPSPLTTPSLPPIPARSGWKLSGTPERARHPGSYVPAVAQAVSGPPKPQLLGRAQPSGHTQAGTHRGVPLPPAPLGHAGALTLRLPPGSTASRSRHSQVPGGGICLRQAQTPRALLPGGVLTEATHLAADASWRPTGLCPYGVSGALEPLPLSLPCNTHTPPGSRPGWGGEARRGQVPELGGWWRRASSVPLTSQSKQSRRRLHLHTSGDGKLTIHHAPGAPRQRFRVTGHSRTPPWVQLCRPAPLGVEGGAGPGAAGRRAVGTHRRPRGPGQQQRQRQEQQQQQREQEGARGRAAEPGGPSHPPRGCRACWAAAGRRPL